MKWNPDVGSSLYVGVGKDHLALVLALNGAGLNEGETGYHIRIVRKSDGVIVRQQGGMDDEQESLQWAEAALLKIEKG